MKENLSPEILTAFKEALTSLESSIEILQRVRADAALDAEARSENDTRLIGNLKNQNPRITPELIREVGDMLTQQQRFNEWARGAEARLIQSLNGLAVSTRSLTTLFPELCDPREPEYSTPWFTAFASAPANIEPTALAAKASAKSALSRVFRPPPSPGAAPQREYLRLIDSSATAK